jgi:sulfur carrier protein ThiS
MPVKLFLSTTLRNLIPGYDAEKGLEVSMPVSMTVGDLCRMLDIPAKEIKLVMVNGRSASLDHELKGDERVGLFPPLGGG